MLAYTQWSGSAPRSTRGSMSPPITIAPYSAAEQSSEPVPTNGSITSVAGEASAWFAMSSESSASIEVVPRYARFFSDSFSMRCRLPSEICASAVRSPSDEGGRDRGVRIGRCRPEGRVRKSQE